jgi:hypothetical protein
LEPADVFYIVTNDEKHRIKFGITTGDPRQRLRYHRKTGYGTLVRLIESFPDALALEQLVKTALRAARISPAHGHEYFDVSALALILDLVDNYPPAATDLPD